MSRIDEKPLRSRDACVAVFRRKTQRATQASRLQPSQAKRTAFSAVELLVVIGILVILISIFVPYLLTIRETDHRVKCADNLRAMFSALSQYAYFNHDEYPRVIYKPQTHPNGYTCFTGPDGGSPFAKGSTVQPSDVTASLWLLVRLKYAVPINFICPSTSDDADPIEDIGGHSIPLDARGNFRDPKNLSYSYASPFSAAPDYHLNDTEKADFALMADKNPGVSDQNGNPTAPVFNAPPLQLAVANSLNHSRSGQNVLYADGHVSFRPTPYCGVEKDNIYTALSPKPLEIGQHPPANGHGVIGRDISPAWASDSYLVPTATDGIPLQIVLPIPTQPATLPASAPVIPTTQSTPHPATSQATAPASAPATTQR